ncbi:MAG: class I tRNA ligase family protein, partial [Streptosporangiaceae bacterium]
PDDERYAGLFGVTATTPVFGAAVPVLAHPLADPAKGTGLAMVCTFGDITDVTWWRDLQLDTRPVLGPDGRLLPGPPPGLDRPDARAAYARLAGLPARAARKQVITLLAEAGALRGDPEQVRHPVKFYEKGDLPLEIITTRQWYIRNGARDPRLRAALLAAGRELHWHPPHMHARYENWVSGLTGDWLVSRQRYFGVPIPVWYPLGADGSPRYDSPLLPDEASLPVDPAASPPPGYAPGQRDVPGGFTSDPDVMDTWATSSLTPQIAGGWPDDEDLLGRVFPMDLRPQAHEIIRTWLFYTVLRSRDEMGALPWRHVAISGWILDPDRKKMSKSAGNVVTPMDLLRDYGTDAVRYWAAGARLGVDTAFDQAQVKIGRRLAVKILNASRFVLGMPEPDLELAPADRPGPASPGPGPVTEPLDRALLHRLAGVAAQCTLALDDFDHARALELAEQFFWLFCDDYLELVKARAYGERGPAAAASAIAALRLALSAVLRLFAPFLPFVTEEVWSWWPAEPGRPASIHRAGWPDPAALLAAGAAAPGLADAGPGGPRAADAPLAVASAVIGAIRKAKSQARLPMKAPVARLAVTGPASELAALAAVLPDVQAAGRVADARLEPAGIAAADEPAADEPAAGSPAETSREAGLAVQVTL